MSRLTKNAEQSAEKVAQDLKEEGYQGQKVTLVSTADMWPRRTSLTSMAQTCKTSGYVVSIPSRSGCVLALMSAAALHPRSQAPAACLAGRRPLQARQRGESVERHIEDHTELICALQLFDIERQRQGTFTLRLIGVRAGTLRDLKSADAPGNLKAAFEHANALQKSGPRHEKGEERLGDLGAFVFGNDDVAQSSQDAERELQEAIRASLEEAGLSEPAPDELPSRRPTPSRTPSDASDPAAAAPATTALQDAGARSSVLGKRPAQSEGGASAEGGAECPLCGRTVHWPAQASDVAANAAMSRHLDSSECGATTGPPLPEPKAKKVRRRGIEAFFGKSL
jgi:hypothetical protein